MMTSHTHSRRSNKRSAARQPRPIIAKGACNGYRSNRAELVAYADQHGLR